MPRHGDYVEALAERLEDFVVVGFLPLFFAFSGLRTQVGLLASLNDWLLCLALIAVAGVGKFGGSFCVARLTGMTARDAASIGVLMNTRGLMELIVLNVGLDLGVISPKIIHDDGVDGARHHAHDDAAAQAPRSGYGGGSPVTH